MPDATIAITIIWIFLFIYAILGSIDFGAGFWAMVYGHRLETNASLLANRYLSPSWKITNVFLVLLVVALVGFFPGAAYVLGTVLLLPTGIMLFLLTVRSTFMVFAHAAGEYEDLLRVVSGVTGLLIPGLLVSVLPISLGGFVTIREGYPQLHFGSLLLSFTEYAHLSFGISTELFLSALFLADYAREAEDEKTYLFYRRIALLLGPLTLAAAVLTTASFVPEASWILAKLQRVGYLFGLSVAAFAVGYSALLWRRRDGKVGYPRIAVVCVVLQYGLAVLAYGLAHLPYIVYPYLTIHQAITNPPMVRSLIIGYAVCTAILIPVFIWFWRLFLKDKHYLRQE